MAKQNDTKDKDIVADEQPTSEVSAGTVIATTKPRTKAGQRVGLALVALVVLCGATAYGVYAWQQREVTKLDKQVADLQAQVTKSKASTATTSDQYAGWKTYTSTYEGLSFRYPSNWTVASQDKNMDGSDGVTLKSSDKTLEINYISAVSGIGGGCIPAECPDSYIHKVIPLTATGAKNALYIIEQSVRDQKTKAYTNQLGIVDSELLGRTPAVGLVSSNEFPFYVMFKGKHSNSSWMLAHYASGGTSDPDGFYADANVQQAVLVMKSLKY